MEHNDLESWRSQKGYSQVKTKLRAFLLNIEIGRIPFLLLFYIKKH